MKDWLLLLSDEQRAQVMMTHIEERNQTERARIANGQYQTVRGFIAFFVFLSIDAASCAAYNVVESNRVQSQRIEAEHPKPFHLQTSDAGSR